MSKVQVQEFYKDDIVNLEVSQLLVQVKILEVRQSFGRVDYLVTPVAGEFERWTTQDSLKKLN